MSDPPPAPRNLRFRLAAVFVGLCVAAGAGEFAARRLGPPRFEPRVSHYEFVKLSDDPLLWGFRPGAEVVQTWDGDPYGTLPPGARMVYPINREGLRGPEFTGPRARVLLVGDSFTFGEGVSAKDTFVGRLEATFGPGLVNAGIPGYGTFEESLRLPDWLGRYRPEAVVVVFVPNDPIHVSESKERGDDLLQSTRGAGSRLWDLLSSRSTAADTEDWYRSFYVGRRRDHWQSARRSLKTMRDAAAAQGVPFGVVLFPLLHRLSHHPFAEIHAEVAAACRAMDVPFLDLGDPLSKVPGPELWVHPADHHPNSRAHGIAADAMAPFVADLLCR